MKIISSYYSNFCIGGRYMVVDCGGGTVDITVHEMGKESGKLKELFKATGGPYGSVCKCRGTELRDLKRGQNIWQLLGCFKKYRF